MDNNENKTGERSSRETGGDGQKRNNFLRRGQAGHDKSRDKKREGAQADKQPKEEAEPPKEEGPITFTEHALDLEPGFAIPPRQSVDLDYQDFTRESFDERDRRPFVPKKRNAVPYEMSETPRSQSETRNTRQSDRRRTGTQEEQAQSGKESGRTENKDTKGNKGREPKQAGQGRQARESNRNDRPRDTTPGAGQETKPRTAAGGEKTGLFAKNRGWKAGGGTNKKNTDTANGGKDSAGEKQGDNSPEQAKESLIRPYWMKK